jgi:hypothetical protein
MTGVSEGVFALLGVTLGTVGEYWRDQRAWRREDQVRWYSTRLETYVRFMNALQDSASLAKDFRTSALMATENYMSGKREDAQRIWTHAMSLRPMLSTRYQDFRVASTSVELIAGRPTREAFRRVAQTYEAGLLQLIETEEPIVQLMKGESPRTSQLDALQRELSDEAEELFELIRSELSITQ